MEYFMKHFNKKRKTNFKCERKIKGLKSPKKYVPKWYYLKQYNTIDREKFFDEWYAEAGERFSEQASQDISHNG